MKSCRRSAMNAVFHSWCGRSKFPFPIQGTDLMRRTMQAWRSLHNCWLSNPSSALLISIRLGQWMSPMRTSVKIMVKRKLHGTALGNAARPSEDTYLGLWLELVLQRHQLQRHVPVCQLLSCARDKQARLRLSHDLPGIVFCCCADHALSLRPIQPPTSLLLMAKTLENVPCISLPNIDFLKTLPFSKRQHLIWLCTAPGSMSVILLQS